MRIVVAPSGYKESLDAETVAASIAQGVRRACPHADIVELPLVDGGEGTARTMARVTGGEVREVRVTGPVGEPVDACFGLLGGSGALGSDAVVELAAAAGLRLVPRDRRDPCRTTTRGVGELISHALDARAQHILVGCGDSGVNDGGAGAVRALGVRLLDRNGVDIPEGGIGLAQLHSIDLRKLDPRIKDATIEIACNMKNLLCGQRGVARVFGPQKGASPDDVEQLSAALDNYADIIEREFGLDVREMPGTGASGGVGAGFHALLGARLRSRFDALLPYFGLDDALRGADLVITAEGGIDYKTARGKIPAEVGERAKVLGVPVIVLAGTIGEDADIVRDHGVSAFFSTVQAPETMEEAMAQAEAEVAGCAENVIRTVMAGMEVASRRGMARG
nr:glycerate kinase [uncultured Sphingomonas sp.]